MIRVSRAGRKPGLCVARFKIARGIRLQQNRRTNGKDWIMTEATVQVSYASAPAGVCPLCMKREVSRKTIYGHAVCKKCLYAFANRRQGGFLLDAVFQMLLFMPIGHGIDLFLAGVPVSELVVQGVAFTFGLLALILFMLKDGFRGHSPGKALTDIQVLDATTNQPIGFLQSAKRNAFLLVGLVPFIGPFASLALILVIAVMVGRGHRLCDGFANTRAVWKKYAANPVFMGETRNAFPVTALPEATIHPESTASREEQT